MNNLDEWLKLKAIFNTDLESAIKENQPEKVVFIMRTHFNYELTEGFIRDCGMNNIVKRVYALDFFKLWNEYRNELTTYGTAWAF